MTREAVVPGGLDFQTLGRRDYWVVLATQSASTPHLIPLTVIVGPDVQDGQGLVVFGGVHGNEYEGPIAIKSLGHEIRTEDVRGRIILIPVLNPGAFNFGTRESTASDGLNLNRVFVESVGVTPTLSSITLQIVAFVRETIWPHADLVIDLHSCGKVFRCAQYASFTLHDDSDRTAERRELARWFGTPLIVCRPSSNSASGLLIDDAERHGKTTIGSELGWGESVNVDGVRYARHGVLAAAIHQGQLHGKINPIGHHASNTQQLAAETFSAAAPYRGHYEPVVECGERVTKGQTAGYVHDFARIDTAPHPIVAGVEGIVLSQAWDPRVDQNQPVLRVIQEIAH